MSVKNVAFSSKLCIFLFIAQERKAISKTGMYFPKKENVVCFLMFFFSLTISNLEVKKYKNVT